MGKTEDQFRVKIGLAEMLKGGVILDVTTAEQAKIAEDAGAAAVMALERVPADIRVQGGVARMASIEKITEIQACVSIPVMAKIRIGHVVEAQMLQSLEVDFIDESEVLTPADEENHVFKHNFTVPFVCGCRNIGEALRRIGELSTEALLGMTDDSPVGSPAVRRNRVKRPKSSWSICKAVSRRLLRKQSAGMFNSAPRCNGARPTASFSSTMSISPTGCLLAFV